MEARVWLLMAAVLAVIAGGAHSAAPFGSQMATAERLQGAGFWPTKGTAPRSAYVGPEACAQCHAAHAATQSTTSMARTATRAAASPVLRAHPSLGFRVGPYDYRITTTDSESTYTVSEGTRALSVPLAFAFGVGKVGQTFLFSREGRWHETHASYFDTPQALGVTPGRLGTFAPRSLEDAVARPVPDAEAVRCFGCHTTASSAGSRFAPADLVPGVTCESCHGPGAAHVAALAAGRLDEAKRHVFHPGQLDPVDSVDFCGACHATWWDVKLAAQTPVAALRSQPHRLQNSACWREGDRRLTCVACHDPHAPLVRETAAYDTRCLACHVTGQATPTRALPGRACPVGTERCASCHMPKYEVPGMHFKFTDHHIRVVTPPRSRSDRGQ